MSFITRDFICNDCNHIFYEILKREKDIEGYTPPCNKCGSVHTSKTLSMPTVLRASYLDGQSRGEGYENMKRAAKVEKEMMNQPVENRGEYKKEIKKLRKVEK